MGTRLAKFKAADLTALFFDKTVVRAVAMRGTLHVMTAADFLALRASLQPGLTAGMLTILRDKAKNLPIEAAMDFARTKFPCTIEALRDALEKKFPHVETRALAYAVRMTLPLVQLPEPDEAWAFPASAKFQAADTWLGAPLGPADPNELVKRYLRGYGPATVRDAQVWTSLPNLALRVRRPDRRAGQALRRRGSAGEQDRAADPLHPGVRQPRARPPRARPHHRRRAPREGHDQEPPGQPRPSSSMAASRARGSSSRPRASRR